MSEAENTLTRLYNLIEDRTGYNLADYRDPTETLDNLLSHEAATGRIPRHGLNWFSMEDRVALRQKASSAPDFRTIAPNLIPEFLAASAYCRDGAEFSSLVAQALMAAHDRIADLQKRTLDFTILTPLPASAMTPAEFSDALAALGWSRRHLAEQLGCDVTLANRWATGRSQIPPRIARWLERRAKDLQRDPAPDGWRVRPNVGASQRRIRMPLKPLTSSVLQVRVHD